LIRAALVGYHTTMQESELNIPNGQKDEATLDSRQGVYIKTYGCQMNEYDSKKILKILEPTYKEVDSPESASLVILNTCSVRDKPEQKVYSLLGELSELKSQNPSLMVGVGGCVAQQEGQTIVKRSKVVDFVFGTHNLSLVPALIQNRIDGKGRQVAVDYRDEWEDLPIGLGGDTKVCALVSISRGCNKNCSYCIVPTTRGVEASRSAEEILREIRLQAHRGAREVLLLGQTVNSYGLDLSPKLSFVNLLSKISEIEGIERIRFMSPHPQEVRQDFIDFLADCPKICRHIHMPLQAGSNRILKLMNRNYRREKFLRIIESLRARVPEVAITTDLIIGFPSETEQDFQDSMDILEKVRFDNSYSFIFSERPGTGAVEMLKSGALTDDISQELKKERLAKWQLRQQEISNEILQTWLGREAEILIDGISSADSTQFKGRTSQNFMVNLTEQPAGLKMGMFAKVKIDHIARYSVRGKVIAFSDSRFS
jgi:tRNA-2-methylthio-N6-dimethylallyladenosine synthase